MVAICYTQLVEYAQAHRFYGLTIQGFLQDRHDWHRTGEPNLLVDASVLANDPACYPRVQDEIEAYRLDRRGGSLVALYDMLWLRLLSQNDAEAGAYAPGLLRKPRVKDTYAMGEIIKAIIARDQTD